MENKIVAEFNSKFLNEYKKGASHSAPTNPSHHFDGRESSVTMTSVENAESIYTVSNSTAVSDQHKDFLVYDYPVRDFIYTLLPSGAPTGSRHIWMLKLASDLLILCDHDEKKVKEILLSLQWVKDVVSERGMSELDNIMVSALESKRKREATYCNELYPSKDMRKAIEKVTKRKYKVLVREAREKATGITDVYQEDDSTELLEKQGKDLKKLVVFFSLMGLVFRNKPVKHFMPGLLVTGALLMTLMTRAWYRFWAEPSKKCRMNCILELIGRSGSGKHMAVDLYNILMAPIKKTDAIQIDALNKWNAEKDKKGGASQNTNTRPNGVFRCMPPETSAAAIREAEFNAVEEIDGEKWPLHIFQFNAELDDLIRQMKKGYMDIETLFLKGFHNEPHGSFLKTANSPVGEYDVHFNGVYTGTADALGKQNTIENFVRGLSQRITPVPMGNTNFEMRENREYTTEDQLCDNMLAQWAEKLDKVKGEIPCKKISDDLYEWTKRRMEDAKEEGSLAMEDLVKRPCWHGINYALPFIVARHWDQMVKDDDGYYKCGPNFVIDKKDRQLALLITNAQFEYQKYFFLSVGEDYYDKKHTDSISNSNHHQRTLLAFRKLPDIFTAEDINQCFEYNGNKNSISSKIKRLRDDGLIQKIRIGEDKGKYRKL